MYNIVLMCQRGASTSLVAQKMRDYAAGAGIEAVINAYPESQAEEALPGADVVLLAPQIRYRKRSLQAQFPQMTFLDIDPTAYGRLEADKIVSLALDYLRTKQS